MASWIDSTLKLLRLAYLINYKNNYIAFMMQEALKDFKMSNTLSLDSYLLIKVNSSIEKGR